MVRSLDLLFHAQQSHQRTTTTIVGTIENGNCGLIAESRKLLKSQMCRLYKGELKGFDEWTARHAHSLAIWLRIC
jgi:hypothetical protein